MAVESHARSYLDDQRSAAVIALLSAGLEPAPTRASMVGALADSRREVAALQRQGHDLMPWAIAEVRGIRENAVVVAMLEVAAYREQTAESYRRRYPERTSQLDRFLTSLGN